MHDEMGGYWNDSRMTLNAGVPFCSLYSYKMCHFFSYQTDSPLKKSSDDALAPPTWTSGMMLNDEHVQPLLFSVLISKKILALCVDHPES